MRGLIAFLLAISGAVAQDGLPQAEELYQKTDYEKSLAIVHRMSSPSAASYNLMGRDYFMLGEYKKATDAFQKSLTLAPSNSVYAHWLGRAYGRRAETSGPFLAPVHASKARQHFEQAVALDPGNE